MGISLPAQVKATIYHSGTNIIFPVQDLMHSQPQQLDKRRDGLLQINPSLLFADKPIYQSVLLLTV